MFSKCKNITSEISFMNQFGAEKSTHVYMIESVIYCIGFLIYYTWLIEI